MADVDVCLILEGTYPYVSGGVSTWTHELIETQSHLTFHIVALLPPNASTKKKYDVPENVVQIDNIFLQKLPEGSPELPKGEADRLFNQIELPILLFQDKSEPKLLLDVIKALGKYREKLGHQILMDSHEAWRMIVRMYNETMGEVSFLDYFWTWRALLGGLYSVLLADLPKAKMYHALCTGYAGVFLARAHLITGRPCVLTEHGIYTNERRIEIAAADWLDDQKSLNLSVEKSLFERDLKDFWIDMFSGYSRMCYSICERIITLYKGNQKFQLMDGAIPEKMQIIPNGIDVERYGSILRKEHERPTIALIGRVVPIKDIKTYIRACDMLKPHVPDLKALVMGPTDEDELYYGECVAMVERMGLQDTIEFTGKVKIDDYFPIIDVMVLTSISEAQPLTILEAGAAGIPTVATDVGACREMIMGLDDEEPYLGQGGEVTPLANPKAIAGQILPLLKNERHYQSCSKAIKARVNTYYNKSDQHMRYKQLYADMMKLETQTVA